MVSDRLLHSPAHDPQPPPPPPPPCASLPLPLPAASPPWSSTFSSTRHPHDVMGAPQGEGASPSRRLSAGPTRRVAGARAAEEERAREEREGDESESANENQNGECERSGWGATGLFYGTDGVTARLGMRARDERRRDDERPHPWRLARRRREEGILRRGVGGQRVVWCWNGSHGFFGSRLSARWLPLSPRPRPAARGGKGIQTNPTARGARAAGWVDGARDVCVCGAVRACARAPRSRRSRVPPSCAPRDGGQRDAPPVPRRLTRKPWVCVVPCVRSHVRVRHRAAPGDGWAGLCRKRGLVDTNSRSFGVFLYKAGDAAG